MSEQIVELLSAVEPAQFARVQREGKGLAGLVIVAWWPGDDPEGLPSSYYHEGSPLLGGYMAPFTLGASEYPKLYKTKRGLVNRLRQFQNPKWANSVRGIAVGVRADATYSVGWWVHPDIPAYPLPKYMLMERPFPGCPRQ